MPEDLDKKLTAITWPFAVIMVLMLTLSMVSVSLVSSMRAYVVGENLWSKAERDAVAHLIRYAYTQDAAEYAAFQRELEVPLGDRVARLELLSAEPDLSVAERGFLAGRNDPDDVPGLIRLFRLFKNSTLFARVIDTWAEGDALILQLQQQGDALHRLLSAGVANPEVVAASISSIEDTRRRIDPVERQFSAQLSAASRLVTNVLLASLAVGTLSLLGLGMFLSRRLLKRGAQMSARLRHQASHDGLTGLANRQEFERNLHLAISRRATTGREQALLYFDLDQFKVVNDTCGHPAGDALIRQVTATVQERLRETDLLARLGGDEFGVLLVDCTLEDALRIAETIRESIAETRFAWESKIFSTTASIGVLSIDPTLRTVAEIMSIADRACYAAKDHGRNRVQAYRPDDGELRARHGEMEWVARISAALETGRFVLFAQEVRPVSEAGDEESRFEILVRMRGAEGEPLVSPMAFIPAAERYGLMPKLDRWVIAHTLRALAPLHVGDLYAPMCVINLSAVSVADPTLIEFIARQFQVTGVPANRIGFELTETAAITNVAQAAELMRRLKALGCSIGLDDFGSGMSSFAYLRSLPVDFLKIDGHFVKDMVIDPVDFAMVETIRRIGGVFGIHTVAEWVEDSATLAALARIGVEYAQGFGIARPQPLDQLVAEWRFERKHARV